MTRVNEEVVRFSNLDSLSDRGAHALLTDGKIRAVFRDRPPLNRLIERHEADVQPAETGGDVDQTKAVGYSRFHRNRQPLVAIDDDGKALISDSIFRTLHPEQYNVIARRVEHLALFEHDDGTKQT
jgi:hypothetical protein